jgi:hypothetical protein
LSIEAQIEDAAAFIERLPLDEVGCFYIDTGGNPVSPDLARLDEYHFGSRGGHWPTSSEILSEMSRPEE